MKSMTGYGRGEASQSGCKLTVEVSSVNRKQSDITIYLPRELEALEPRLRDVINKKIGRGRLTVKVTLHAADGLPGGKVEINGALARAYAREFLKLQKELGLDGAISLELVVRAPGVMRSDAELFEADLFWPVLARATTQALDGLIGMRVREGAHLKDDLEKRIANMRKSAAKIQKRAPLMVKYFQQQLRERIRNAGLDLPGMDDERLLKEVVFYADRSDVTEELTRLTSHFKQFEDCAKSKEPVGRTLDFLAQEMNREINTIGSKAADSAVSQEVVQLKAELEKFREQVQNVE